MVQVPPGERGDAPRPFMVVGQAPAKGDGTAYRPFGNPGGGGGLFRWLAEAGFSEEEFRARAYLTALVKCYPGRAAKGDRAPGRGEISNCAAFLQREIKAVEPVVVIPVGKLALEAFLPGGLSLGEAVGREFPREGRVIIPLPHPSGASLWNNDPDNRELRRRAITLIGQKNKTPTGVF